jgi:hypothetical protein
MPFNINGELLVASPKEMGLVAFSLHSLRLPPFDI